MEIVSRQKCSGTFKLYSLYQIFTCPEWKLVDIRLTGDSEKYFAITRMADLVHSLFREKEGKSISAMDVEIFMLIRLGHNTNPLLLSRKIQDRLSAVTYEIVVHEPTAEGLQRLEMLITYEESGTLLIHATHAGRNVILVAATRSICVCW